MQFDFQRFYTDYNIPYWTSGKNCQEGWVNIQCPHCSDKSNHCGGNPYGGYIYCWKCDYHTLAEHLDVLIENERIGSIIQKYKILHNVPEREKKEYNNTEIDVPGDKLKEVHKKYIRNRGFDPDYLETKYQLKGTNHVGEYNFRIIIPIIYNNQIISYEGRDYTNKQSLKTKPCKQENEIIPHNDVLFNIDNCKSDTIILCEGAWDVFRLGNNSCSCFTSNITSKQFQLLKKYKKVFILFDNEKEAQEKAEKIAVKLNSMGVESEVITLNDKNDAAELTEDEAIELKEILGVE